MSKETRRILDKRYGYLLALVDSAKRSNDDAIVATYTATLDVLQGIYTDLLGGVPIDWNKFDANMRESVYYTLIPVR